MNAEKENAAPGGPGHGSFGKREDNSTLGSESQDALAGRLLMLRRILLTAVELIEDIVFPAGGRKP